MNKRLIVLIPHVKIAVRKSLGNGSSKNNSRIRMFSTGLSFNAIKKFDRHIGVRPRIFKHQYKLAHQGNKCKPSSRWRTYFLANSMHSKLCSTQATSVDIFSIEIQHYCNSSETYLMNFERVTQIVKEREEKKFQHSAGFKPTTF